MSLKGNFRKIVLKFKVPGGTSRGVMSEKISWIIEIWNDQNPQIKGIGECSIIEGLSPDFTSVESYEEKLREVFSNLNEYARDENRLRNFPSIYFGLETALLDFNNGGKRILHKNSFSLGKVGIPINGLIWMGSTEFMSQQIKQKISDGFTCIKLKIGAIDFNQELEILKSIRNEYGPKDLIVRVDANGAFNIKDAPTKLKKLAELEIHSIEQPIATGNHLAMKELCSKEILPIALDEELIGIKEVAAKEDLLIQIRPQFIILKPSLMGGIKGSKEWIEIATRLGIGWWMTSALESNIGLNSIAQFTATYETQVHQGLGTGSLYTNNIPSHLHIRNGYIFHDPQKLA